MPRIFKFDEEKETHKHDGRISEAKKWAVFNLASDILAAKIETGVPISELISKIVDNLSDIDDSLKSNLIIRLTNQDDRILKITSHTL